MGWSAGEDLRITPGGKSIRPEAREGRMPMDSALLKELQARALAVRRDILGMLKTSNLGSLRSSFSAVELLVWLYGAILSLRPEAPAEAGRDRFVLSRVSAAPALYAVLAGYGFFGRDELWSYGRLGSLLQTTPECRRSPGVDVSCGAPGMGTGIALGLALSLRDCRPVPNVLCLLGAEELEAGPTGEALARAAAQPPSNLTLIVECAIVEGAEDLSWRPALIAERLAALGCTVVCADGHDYASLQEAWSSLSGDRLRVILARTVHGKGLPDGKGLPGLRERAWDDADTLDPQVTEHLIRGLEDTPS